MNKNTIRTYDDDSRELNCACLKLKDGSWKDCDCSLSQHFVCRKSDQTINLDILMRKRGSFLFQGGICFSFF